MKLPYLPKSGVALWVAAVALGFVALACSVSREGLGNITGDADGGEEPPPTDGGDKPGKKPLGAVCNNGSECERGFCAEGVCCNSACTQGCVSCKVTGMEGACMPLAAGAEPRVANTCRVEAAVTCGLDGKCNGQGGCRPYPAGTPCGQSSCEGASEKPAPVCNGTGTCTDVELRTCAPYACSGRACAAECRSKEDCSADTVCLDRKCQAVNAPLVRRSIGQPQIDGVTDDTVWNTVARLPIAKVTEGNVGSEMDLTAHFKVLWTTQDLYIAVDVQDSNLSNDSADPLQDDAIVIAVDANNSRGQMPDGQDDVAYVFGLNDPTPVASVSSAFRQTATGYGFEARIPWTSLGVAQPAEGVKFSFQIGVVDDDNGGAPDAVVVWTGMAGQREALTRPALFGQLILGPS